MLNDLAEFKNFTLARLDLNELIALASFGRQIRNEYEAQKVEEPEWVNIQLVSLKREIQIRLADKQDARRRHIKLQLDSLKTPTERKAELQAELAELDKVPA